MSSAILTCLALDLYLLNKSLLLAVLKDLWLMHDFGVATLVMPDINPLLTENALPPLWDKIAEAPSIIEQTSSLAYDRFLY